MTSLMPRPFIPDLVRLLEWPFGDHHAMRIEDYREDGKYVLRAELPGMDPEKDIHIQVHGTELSITAERTVEKHDKTHSGSAGCSLRSIGTRPLICSWHRLGLPGPSQLRAT